MNLFKTKKFSLLKLAQKTDRRAEKGLKEGNQDL
jgi:hypothetical protein